MAPPFPDKDKRLFLHNSLLYEKKILSDNLQYFGCLKALKAKNINNDKKNILFTKLFFLEISA